MSSESENLKAEDSDDDSIFDSKFSNSTSSSGKKTWDSVTDLGEDASTPTLVVHGDVTFMNIGKLHIGRSVSQVVQRTDKEEVEIDEFSEVLRNQYSVLYGRIAPLPWCQDFAIPLDDIYTSLELVGLGGYTDTTPITMEELFDNENRHSIRIFMEGNPGYGKTTLTLKLALDWVKGQPYLVNYEIVFLVQLKYLSGSLKDYILNEFVPGEDDENQEAYWESIKSRQENVLFILDGLDELSAESKPDVVKLMEGKLFNKASVLLTSRYVSGDNPIPKLCSKRVLIKGFKKEQIRDFSSRYYNAVQSPDLAIHFAENILSVPFCATLASCPLACLLLCVLYEEQPGTLPTKMSDLYHELFRCLIKRSVLRNAKAGEELDLDWEDRIPEPYQNLLLKLGQLCLLSLQDDQLIMKLDMLRKHLGNDLNKILSMGLLMKDSKMSSRSKLQKMDCYQFLHKTFLEYLAALYLNAAEYSQDRFSEELRKLVCRNRDSFWMVAKFLVGVEGEKSSSILASFKLSKIDENAVFDVLEELRMDEKNVGCLAEILVDTLTLDFNNPMTIKFGQVLGHKKCTVKNLVLAWNKNKIKKEDKDQFFRYFVKNSSIHAITFRIEDYSATAKHIAQVVSRPNIRHFETGCFNCGPKQAIFELMAQTFKKKALTALNLPPTIDADSLLALVRLLETKMTAQSLRLEMSSSNKYFEEFSSLIARTTTIKHLELTIYPRDIKSKEPLVIKDLTVDPNPLKFCLLFSSLRHKECRLESLMLDFGHLRDDVVDFAYLSLSSALSVNQHLRTLTLFNCSFNSLRPVLSNLVSIENLELVCASGLPIFDEDVLFLFEKVSKSIVRKLSLMWWTFSFQNIVSFETVSQLIAQSHLEELVVSESTLKFHSDPDELFCSAPLDKLLTFPLRILQFPSSKLVVEPENKKKVTRHGPELLQYAHQSWFPHVRHLNLSTYVFAGLDDQDSVDFFEALSQNFPSLEILELDGLLVKWADPVFTSQAVIDTFQTMSTLTVVRLTRAVFVDRSDDAESSQDNWLLTSIFEGVPNLTEISLPNLTHATALHLASLLEAWSGDTLKLIFAIMPSVFSPVYGSYSRDNLEMRFITLHALQQTAIYDIQYLGGDHPAYLLTRKSM